MFSWITTTLAFIFFPAMMWYWGTFEKYPELAFPLLFIWYAVGVAPLLPSNKERRWRELEKKREVAVKKHDDDELSRIDAEMYELHNWAAPVTVGHLKAAIDELEVKLRTKREH